MVGMIWALVFLMRGTWAGLAAAIACAFAALISTLNAIVIAPVGLLVLVMTRQQPRRWIVWSAAMLVCGVAYFYHYHAPPIPRVDWASAAGARHAADTFLICLGSPLSAGDVHWSRALGVFTVAGLLLLWVGVCRSGSPGHAGIVGLGVIAVGCAAAVALGRSATSATVGLESKYVVYSTLALVSFYLGLASLPGLPARRQVVATLTAVIAIGLVAANVFGAQQARVWQRNRHRADYLLQTIEMQPDENIASIFFVAQVRDAAAYLRAAHLGPFRETVDVLVPPRWREGQPTHPITPNSPVHTHVLCPVDTLVDVGLIVSPAGGTGAVNVTVATTERVIGRGRLVTDTAKPAQYVRVDLDSPLRGCRGTDLIVEATSDTANSAGAFHAWTYPAYDADITRQGGRVFERRSLGLTFNAFSYGLID